jgi:hypothetical protein
MISKQIVEQFEGKIWVDSEPGFGSTFTFKLKLMDDQNNSGIYLNQIEIPVAKYDYKFLWRP